ncbi:MAG: glycoside hydrolase family 5 protein [Kineosporiaceae bacterium]
MVVVSQRAAGARPGDGRGRHGSPRGPSRPPAHARSRRTRRAVVAAVVAAALAAAALAGVRAGQALATPPSDLACPADAVQARAVAGLQQFTHWLRSGGAQGFVGEVGWPAGADAAAWGAVAETWYKAADAARLPVTAWAAGRWPAAYPMAIYRASADDAALDTAGPQAETVERHGNRSGLPRGVAVASGAFGSGSPGGRSADGNAEHYGFDYTYDTTTSYAYLASRGVRVIRLAVAWERVQPVPFGPLDGTQVRYLQQVMRWSEQLGLVVVLDLHGYGDRPVPGRAGGRSARLGSPALPLAAFADVWRRLAALVADRPVVVGYGLLNEPVRLAASGRAGARLWEQASQAAVTAVRASRARGTVLVSAYGSTSPLGWPHLHQRPWIRDPLGDVAYEAHAYFDADGSGHYALPYAAELAAASRAAASPGASSTHLTAGTCVRLAPVPDPTLRRWTP